MVDELKLFEDTRNFQSNLPNDCSVNTIEENLEIDVKNSNVHILEKEGKF